MNVKFSEHLMFDPFNENIQKLGFSINDLQEKFINIWQCVHCEQIRKDPHNFSLIQHIEECPKKYWSFEQNIPQPIQNLLPQKLKPIQLRNENVNDFQSNNNLEQLLLFDSNDNVEDEVERILEAGNLSDGSKKQYKGPLRRFYKWLWQKQKCQPSCMNILNYIQTMNPGLHDIKALSRLRKIERIILKEDERIFFKETKQILVEGKKQRPNTSWNQQTIQEFIDDLVLHKMETLAFRIFILYYQGERISELSQITFEQICSEVVVYLPKIQIKQGSKQKEFQTVQLIQFKLLKNIWNQKVFHQTNNLTSANIKKAFRTMQKQLQLALLFCSNSNIIKQNNIFNFFNISATMT